jgi:estrogen-related receptor beta like 1
MDHKLRESIGHLQVIKAELSVLKPQIRHASDTISAEYDLQEKQTKKFNERFRHQIAEYHQVKAKIRELEESMHHHDQKTNTLNDHLEELSIELADLKKKIHDKGKSMTDTAPLVEMRKAIQRLKDENREFDITIGVLYHELTQARKGEGSYDDCGDVESEDGTH